ncbi:MAG: P-II family nitrogen regulator [Gammaproteobacteria bacterium]
MKLIIAIIQQEKLEAVMKELDDSQVYLRTVSSVLGCGRQKGHSEVYRGMREVVNLLKKIRIEIAVNEDFVEPAVQAIIKGARTENIGDGKIFVQELPECIRIRTGERGKEAVG